jgi:hypothetical protein
MSHSLASCMPLQRCIEADCGARLVSRRLVALGFGETWEQWPLHRCEH